MKKLLFALLLVVTAQAYATRFYFTQTGAGNSNGLSWANAKPATSLCNFLSLPGGPAPFDTVWLAQGTYYTVYTPATSSDYLAAFTIHDSVAVYGGFAGIETSISQRNIAANPTILSGDIYLDGIQTNNSIHTVLMAYSSTLDGVIVQDGYADGRIPSGSNNFSASVGAGVFSAQAGRTVYNSGQTNVVGSASSSLTIRNCRFINNYSSKHGGAVAIFSIWRNKMDAEISNCVFLNNECGMYGGAIYATSSNVLQFNPNTATPDSANGNLNLRLTNCRIDSNTTQTSRAGALYLDANATMSSLKPQMKVYIDSSQFTGNTAGSCATIGLELSGGGKRAMLDLLSIRNSMFKGNYSLNTSGLASVIGVFGGADTAGVFNFDFYNTKFINNVNTVWGSEGVFKANTAVALKGTIKKCQFLNNTSSFGASCLNFTIGQPGQQFLYKSSLLIDSTIFRANVDTGLNGMGVMDLLYWNPTDTLMINNSVFSKNIGQFAQIECRNNGAIRFYNCAVDSNRFQTTGQGDAQVVIESGNGFISYASFNKCSFRKNYNPSTSSNGAGCVLIRVSDRPDTAHMYFSHCLLSENKGFYGGAVQLRGGNTIHGKARLFFNNSIISGNDASYSGGAIASIPGSNGGKSEISLNNCLVSGNTSASHGAALYSNDARKFIITNSTIASNYISGSNGYGAGLYVNPTFSSDTSKIINSIFWDNVANGFPHREMTATGSAQPKIKVINSIVKGGFNSSLYSEDANVDTVNVQNADPLFVAPTSATAAPVAGGDYHVQACSPAVNTGNNAYATMPSDLDNTSRIRQLVVDLGAYESNYTPCTPTAIKGNGDSYEASFVKLYPNPNNGRFIVDSEEECQLTVYNALGQKVYYSEIGKGKNQVEIDHVSKGIHVVQLTVKDKRFFKKIVIE